MFVDYEDEGVLQLEMKNNFISRFHEAFLTQVSKYMLSTSLETYGKNN